MAKFKGTFKSKKAKLDVNLNELFGKRVRLTPALKEHIGQAIIDKIRERSSDNKDVNGIKFKSYSKEYIKSDDFKAYGKKKGDINLELTGDMMSELDITKVKGNTLTISWEDSTEQAKAYNHNIGDTVKKREFLGLQSKEANEIAKEFKSDVKTVNVRSDAGQATAAGLADALATRKTTLDELVNSLFEVDNEI